MAGGGDQLVPGGQGGLGDLAAESAAAAGEKEDLWHVLYPFALNATPF
jgi:hypothetical protein